MQPWYYYRKPSPERRLRLVGGTVRPTFKEAREAADALADRRGWPRETLFVTIEAFHKGYQRARA